MCGGEYWWGVFVVLDVGVIVCVFLSVMEVCEIDRVKVMFGDIFVMCFLGMLLMYSLEELFDWVKFCYCFV